MGLIYADIELINCDDSALAKKYIIGEEEIKRISINILVDTGSYMLAINESMQEQLKLSYQDKRNAQLANGHVLECDVVGPVQLKFKNRSTICQAMILPGESEPLLGAIPLEDMDVLIDPLRQQLIVNPEHPNYAQLKMK